ncbi:hypothetical protein D039_0192A, partial [Vibrio parahaemolyticus EKP-028]
MDLPAI